MADGGASLATCSFLLHALKGLERTRAGLIQCGQLPPNAQTHYADALPCNQKRQSSPPTSHSCVACGRVETQFALHIFTVVHSGDLYWHSARLCAEACTAQYQPPVWPFTLLPEKDDDCDWTCLCTMLACRQCGKTLPPHLAKVCGRCRKSHYCSRACLRADWPSHKKNCRLRQ